VRRIESGSTLGELKGQQVLQLSLRRRASGLKQPGSHIRPIKHRRGEFNMELGCRGRVEVENRGYIVELFAENESVLSRLLPDLARAWRKQPAQLDVSRIYGRNGVIHDPRTGVTSNRIKEVWKGRLDEFMEGWRRMG
jgi:hypothetical protein